jgi:DNA ligase-1
LIRFLSPYVDDGGIFVSEGDANATDPTHAGLALRELNHRVSGCLQGYAHEPRKGEQHLQDLLREVTAVGGEGLMLREPGSKYVRVRSPSLLKVKTFIDTEAKVIGHGPGKNRLQGMMGTLMCELPVTGATFDVGTGFSDAQRNWCSKGY